jgi:hypothetical protein
VLISLPQVIALAEIAPRMSKKRIRADLIWFALIYRAAAECLQHNKSFSCFMDSLTSLAGVSSFSPRMANVTAENILILFIVRLLQLRCT